MRLFKFAPHSYRCSLETIPNPEEYKIQIVFEPDDAYLEITRVSTDREAAIFLHAVALIYKELGIKPNYRIHVEKHNLLGYILVRTYTDKDPGFEYHDYFNKNIPIHPILKSVA